MLFYFKAPACLLLFIILVMLTRREVLMEFRRLGVATPSSLKISLKEFEKYVGIHHGVEVVKTKRRVLLPAKNYQDNENGIKSPLQQMERRVREKGPFMKKIFFIFLTCFSLILFSFSLIYSLDNFRSLIPGVLAPGQEVRMIPEPVLLLSLGIAMVLLAGLVKRKFLKS
jgi:hypothetical protein